MRYLKRSKKFLKYISKDPLVSIKWTKPWILLCSPFFIHLILPEIQMVVFSSWKDWKLNGMDKKSLFQTRTTSLINNVTLFHVLCFCLCKCTTNTNKWKSHNWNIFTSSSSSLQDPQLPGPVHCCNGDNTKRWWRYS